MKMMGNTESASGIGDITAGTFLAWHWKNFHFVTGVDITSPSGAYDEEDTVNIGRNYYTFEPGCLLTYISDSGYEISTKFMYDLNTENKDTNYQSGNEFHIDYYLGRHINSFTYGINGYYYRQVTDDKRDGSKVQDYKGEVMALGPGLQYNYKNMVFNIRYQKEFSAKNRAEGEKLWLKFVYAF